MPAFLLLLSYFSFLCHLSIPHPVVIPDGECLIGLFRYFSQRRLILTETETIQVAFRTTLNPVGFQTCGDKAVGRIHLSGLSQIIICGLNGLQPAHLRDAESVCAHRETAIDGVSRSGCRDVGAFRACAIFDERVRVFHHTHPVPPTDFTGHQRFAGAVLSGQQNLWISQNVLATCGPTTDTYSPFKLGARVIVSRVMASRMSLRTMAPVVWDTAR